MNRRELLTSLGVAAVGTSITGMKGEHMNPLANLDEYGSRLFGEYAVEFSKDTSVGRLMGPVMADYRAISTARRDLRTGQKKHNESLALMGWYGILISAISFRMGLYEDSKGWSHRARVWGRSLRDLRLIGQSYAREGTLEIWYGSPEAVRDGAVKGLQEIARSADHNIRAQLAGQLMLGYASLGNREQAEIAEMQFRHFTENAHSELESSAFTWLPEQSWNARALAHAQVGSGDAIGLYEEAEKTYLRHSGMRVAVYPRFLTRLNKAHAIASTDPTTAVEWSLDVFNAMRKGGRQPDRIYRDRALATLSALPKDYLSPRTKELAYAIQSPF